MKNCLQVDEQEQNLPGARREQTESSIVTLRENLWMEKTLTTHWTSVQRTSKCYRKAADGHASTAGVGFFRREGLIYRRLVPPDRDREDMSVEQLVLPLKLNIHGATFTYSFVACSSKGTAVLHLWAVVIKDY